MPIPSSVTPQSFLFHYLALCICCAFNFKLSFISSNYTSNTLHFLTLCFLMGFIIRSYEGQSDRAQVEDLERRCEVGPAESVFLFTDPMGDPICRIRNSPMYNMLVAEKNKEIIGVIQGSIKVVAVQRHDLEKAGYVLGLRVAPRKGLV